MMGTFETLCASWSAAIAFQFACCPCVCLVSVRGSKSDSHRQKLQATVIFFERCLAVVAVVVLGGRCEEPEREWAVNTVEKREDVRAGLAEEEGESRGSCF